MIALGFIISGVVWWFIGGSIFMVMPAFMHSDVNLGISYAKRDGKSTLKLQIIRIGICSLYLIFPLGFYGLFHLWF